MSGSYLGGHTVITVRRGPGDMARRQAHWKRKLARQQLEHDAERQAERDAVLLKIAAMDKRPSPEEKLAAATRRLERKRYEQHR